MNLSSIIMAMKNTKDCKEITECLCCQSDNIRTILDLGKQSPANNYNVTDKYPLRLNVCLNCSHAQLSHQVDPDILFKNYPYMSGVSKTMKEHYKWFASHVVRSYHPKARTVFEIGCNDRSQLNEFDKLGLVSIGVDPAENISLSCAEEGLFVFNAYFPECADSINKRFDIVVAQNVFAHNSNPYEFLMGCRKLMTNDSILVIQNSQSKMVNNYQFDTIYHEHISFFNKRSISKLFSRADFEIIDYKFLPKIHGGSDMYVLKKLPEITALDYSDFQNRSYRFANDFKRTVESLRKEGNEIICYGAAAKMINLIRFTGIKPDHIIDDTPTKKDQCVMGIDVEGFDSLKKLSGVIIPVWNFYDEIKAKVKAKHDKKFKFLKYIPKIKIEK